MKIPESIRIGFVYYDIIYYRERRIDLSLGSCNSKTCVIEIAEDIPGRTQFKTFIHECLHGIVEQYGIVLPEDKEEEIVKQFSTGISEIVEQLTLRK